MLYIFVINSLLKKIKGGFKSTLYKKFTIINNQDFE